MDHDLDSKLRDHIGRQTEQNIRLGMNPEEGAGSCTKKFSADDL
jgi:hypothetical protein